MVKFNKKNNVKDKFSKGFSLIELLVSVAILVIVSGLVFFNQSGFNNSILVENLAYEVSLVVRQAQSYGLQSKQAELGGTFEAGYGVYFTTDVSGNNKVILYADIDGDKVYNDSGTDIELETLKMAVGNTITNLCVGAPCSDVTELDISFIRPDPMAYINTDKNIGEIYITSARNETKKVVVNKLGQISIE